LKFLEADNEAESTVLHSVTRQSSNENRDFELDHKYCRSPIRTNSSLSSDDQQFSPPQLDTGFGESSYFSDSTSDNYSTGTAEMVQDLSHSTSVSPPAMGVEDLNIMDFNFETLDALSLLRDDPMKGLESDADAMINFADLGMCVPFEV
jgi:hypothetical protein